jgi:hypothetical protein
MEHVQQARALGPAATFVGLIEADDYEGALALNEEIANEMPFVAVLERWFIRKIAAKWGKPAAVEAVEAWTKAQAEGDREAGEAEYAATMAAWAADERQANAVQRARLADLSARLARVEPQGDDFFYPGTQPEIAAGPADAEEEDEVQFGKRLLAGLEKRGPITPEEVASLTEEERAWGDEGVEDDFVDEADALEAAQDEIVQLKQQLALRSELMPAPSVVEVISELTAGVVNKNDLLGTAKRFLDVRWGWEGHRTLRFWQSQFWIWNGKCYRPLSDEALRMNVYRFLADAEIEVRGKNYSNHSLSTAG